MDKSDTDVVSLAKQFRDKMQEVLDMVQDQNQSYFSAIGNNVSGLYNYGSAAAASVFNSTRSRFLGSAAENVDAVVVNDQTENSAVDENLFIRNDTNEYVINSVLSEYNGSVLTKDGGTKWADGVVNRQSQKTFIPSAITDKNINFLINKNMLYITELSPKQNAVVPTSAVVAVSNSAAAVVPPLANNNNLTETTTRNGSTVLKINDLSFGNAIGVIVATKIPGSDNKYKLADELEIEAIGRGYEENKTVNKGYLSYIVECKMLYMNSRYKIEGDHFVLKNGYRFGPNHQSVPFIPLQQATK